MEKEIREVDTRTFLLGLDELYRENIKKHERGELLNCARKIASELGVEPADAPVEGYYYEEEELKEYFLLIRGLQGVEATRVKDVKTPAKLDRLLEVFSSRIYGRFSKDMYLLGSNVDIVGEALSDCAPDWKMDRIIDRAHELAVQSDDFSIVALAALSRDPVVIAAIKESVVLYTALAAGACAYDQAEIEYRWTVDPEIAKRAELFVRTFNNLFDEDIPSPEPDNAEYYYEAASDADIIGRCVRIGFDPLAEPTQYYHWAIKHGQSGAEVEEFWDTEVWTTERYSQKLFGFDS